MNGRVFASGIVSEREPGVPDGMKCDLRGNVWVHGAGRRLGLCAVGRADRQGAGARDGRQPRLGRARLAHALHVRHALGLFGQDQGGTAARALHASAHGRPGAPRRSLSASPRGPRPRPRRPPPPPSAPALKARPAGSDRCALIIQDMQNDVVMEGGAFASSGSPAHCKQQNAIANAMRLAEACRRRGVMVIHVWFVVEPGAPGVTLNAPLFEGWSKPRRWCAAPGAQHRRRPRGQAGRSRGRKDAHERLGRLQARDGAEERNAATSSSSPAPGPTCRSSTPRARAPTRATS